MVKKTFACASVGYYEINTQLSTQRAPEAGDVGIFRICSGGGQFIKGANTETCYLFDGDYLMAAFGNRYATNQVEGYVPETPVRYCQLLSKGGVAGILKSANGTFKGKTIELEWLGYAVDGQGQPINTIRYDELMPFHPSSIRSKVILSIGSSMDSGKTTSAAYLAGGLSQHGKTTAYVKLTGTAFPKDAQFALGRGADLAIDFTALGFPSTYLCSLDTLLGLYITLICRAQDAIQPDYIIVEIADGILQRETSMLLQNDAFMATVSGVMLSCGDSLGVISGLQILNQWGIHPFAVSGLLTASELLIEEVQNLISPPIKRLADLLSADILALLELPVASKTEPESQAVEALLANLWPVNGRYALPAIGG